LQPHERIHFLSSKQTSDYHSPIPIKKTVKFSPLPLIIQSSCSTPTVSSDHKSEKPSSITNKRQVVNRSRTGRDKLLRLFNNHIDLKDERKGHPVTCSDYSNKNESAHLYQTPVPSRRYDQVKSSSKMVPPVIAEAAHRWQYPPSSHVYAVKIVNDIKTVSKEYIDWLASKSNKASGVMQVPRLSLEWPKSWSFSNL
jgi:hypothetical protein